MFLHKVIRDIYFYLDDGLEDDIELPITLLEWPNRDHKILLMLATRLVPFGE